MVESKRVVGIRVPLPSRSTAKARVARASMQPSSPETPTEITIFHRDQCSKFRVLLPLEGKAGSGKTEHVSVASHTAPCSAKVSAAKWRNTHQATFSDKTCTSISELISIPSSRISRSSEWPPRAAATFKMSHPRARAKARLGSSRGARA